MSDDEVTHCIDCGEELDTDARQAGRDMCFDCDCIHQGAESDR
jgi:hypothetical protein